MSQPGLYDAQVLTVLYVECILTCRMLHAAALSCVA